MFLKYFGELDINHKIPVDMLKTHMLYMLISMDSQFLQCVIGSMDQSKHILLYGYTIVFEFQ